MRPAKTYDNADFYNSQKWRKLSAAYMSSKNYICERCGKPARICHHKIWLDGDNVHDAEIALNFGNLEALCIDCHNAEHLGKQGATIFGDDGSIKAVRETPEAEDFKRQQAAIDELFTKIEQLNKHIGF